ncbi:putative oxidoreductase [Streptomyces ambofaciens ATCC 23877]|uniref:Putative oxidoreductase n=1 Tax=Streptomyces ambofaciens (strain ATCC 23877 / 3486 / DSM 40053 / JCM 4204 / NBRC 12836 / NRRL B-2516) TaxID=278992 RepID=A3KJV8_STRA7|nr:SDR family NAD(P)-dependent oxidoreductase [Streptomyces ambofaciens]AKZ54149.1 putative oxidoreductase [Streptomyces ambofaciens ATCC 23877]CAJ89993.1 putative oxidoreductase [Streptomyces ambofaciens ATCC 23877]
MRLEGKVVLVPGTARGRGRAAALRFAAEGALVVGGDLLHEEAVETRRLIAREGGTALTPGPLDVTDEEAVRAWAEEAVDAFGGIDVVYADADAPRRGATGGRPHTDFADTTCAGLHPVRLTVRAAWPHLVRSRGCVVTVGSTAGPAGSPAHRRTARSAAKGAVVALTRRLAAEGAPHGVRVNCVRPGSTDTEGSQGGPLAGEHPRSDVRGHVPRGRPGHFDDFLDAAVFLASAEASHLTGADLVVDGGWSTVLPGAPNRKAMHT